MGHCICFCTTCKVMLMDPDSIDHEDMSITELEEVKDLEYTAEDVENNGNLFFSKCPVCDCVAVMYRYECHSGGPGA